jgi:hypothetical protein
MDSLNINKKKIIHLLPSRNVDSISGVLVVCHLKSWDVNGYFYPPLHILMPTSITTDGIRNALSRMHFCLVNYMIRQDWDEQQLYKSDGHGRRVVYGYQKCNLTY